MPLALRLEEPRDRRCPPGPIRGFDLQLLLAAAGERVELGAARVLGLAPLRVQPSGALQPLQRREQRSWIHLEYAARDLFHAAGDTKAMHGLQAQRFQDQHVQRALDYVRFLVVHTREVSILTLDCQDMTVNPELR